MGIGPQEKKFTCTNPVADFYRIKRTVPFSIICLLPCLKETAAIRNFWSDKAAERKKVTGQIEDEIYYAKVDGLSARAGELATEIMQLAKRRETDLR